MMVFVVEGRPRYFSLPRDPDSLHEFARCCPVMRLRTSHR